MLPLSSTAGSAQGAVVLCSTAWKVTGEPRLAGITLPQPWTVSRGGPAGAPGQAFAVAPGTKGPCAIVPPSTGGVPPSGGGVPASIGGVADPPSAGGVPPSE